MKTVQLSFVITIMYMFNCAGLSYGFIGAGDLLLRTGSVNVSVRRHSHLTSSILDKNIYSPTWQSHARVTTQRSSTQGSNSDVDSLVYRASKTLTASTWLSWWSQVILTVISSVTFVFARNVMESQTVSPLDFSKVASKFVLPGVGIVTSIMSIIWTWGGRRLARRFVRRSTSQVEAANLLRRVITVGATLNLIGLLTSLLGAQYIVGTLVAKAMQNVVGFGGNVGGLVASQTLQPLDVLVVQANTNVLTSHFVSLACLLWLTRMVDLLDPPSLEEDN